MFFCLFFAKSVHNVGMNLMLCEKYPVNYLIPWCIILIPQCCLGLDKLLYGDWPRSSPCVSGGFVESLSCNADLFYRLLVRRSLEQTWTPKDPLSWPRRWPLTSSRPRENAPPRPTATWRKWTKGSHGAHTNSSHPQATNPLGDKSPPKRVWGWRKQHQTKKDFSASKRRCYLLRQRRGGGGRRKRHMHAHVHPL